MVKDTVYKSNWQDVTELFSIRTAQNRPEAATQADSGGFRHVSSIAADMVLKASRGPLKAIVKTSREGRA